MNMLKKTLGFEGNVVNLVRPRTPSGTWVPVDDLCAAANHRHTARTGKPNATNAIKPIITADPPGSKGRAVKLHCDLPGKKLCERLFVDPAGAAAILTAAGTERAERLGEALADALDAWDAEWAAGAVPGQPVPSAAAPSPASI